MTDRTCHPEVLREELLLVQPLINIYEMEKEFLIEADLAGSSKEKIEVTMEGDKLIISGRRDLKFPEGAQALHQELFPFQFYRELTLGKEVEREGITAQFENGLLKIRLKKTEKSALKKITVE